MKNEGKKYRRSPISIVCYVLAAIMLVYVCYTIVSTVQTINEYYAQYGMSAQPIEYVTYSLQAALQYIVYMIVFFMCGYILDAVRMNNENNYKTDEEIADAVAAKKQAREAKKLARGEAAAIKAGNVTTDETSSVEADFAKSLDEELKADEKKAEIKNGSGNGNESENGSGSGNGNGGGYRKPRNNNYNRSDSNRNSSNRGGGNSGRKKPEGSKNDGGSGKNDGVKKEGGKREGGSGRSGGNGGQRRSNNRKPADKPKLEDATKTKADDGFEVVIAEPESKE